MRSQYLGRVLSLWGVLAAVVLVVAMGALAEPHDPESLGPGHDARAYWTATLEAPYSPAAYGSSDESFCWTESTWVSNCYRYSPAFLLAFSPLQSLAWPLFVATWAALMLGVLFWMTRSLLFLPAILLALPELWGGNITILLAAAIVVGFSKPVAWALPLLTKVTPGIGLLWFGVRREWMNLALALAATIAVIALAAVFTPALWDDWYSQLMSGTSTSTVPGAVPIPLMFRLPVAVALIVIAARRGQPWLVPIGILLAMPVIWWGYIAILAASIALKRDDLEQRVERLLVRIEDRYDRRLEAQRTVIATD
jgi:hypothetical protein